MNKGRLLGRGISFPPRICNGRVACSEGKDNVRESIRVILLTELRERLRLPEFGGGLYKFLFEPNTVTTRQLLQDRITKALTQWEPRIAVESVSVEPDPAKRDAAIATITYRLVATQTRERVNLNVTLAT